MCNCVRFCFSVQPEEQRWQSAHSIEGSGPRSPSASQQKSSRLLDHGGKIPPQRNDSQSTYFVLIWPCVLTPAPAQAFSLTVFLESCSYFHLHHCSLFSCPSNHYVQTCSSLQKMAHQSCIQSYVIISRASTHSKGLVLWKINII